jgi:hypothetical protein
MVSTKEIAFIDPPYRISKHCSWRSGPTSLRFC